MAERACSATASSSTAAPVTSFSSSSAFGFCPSAPELDEQRAGLAALEPVRPELFAHEARHLRRERPRAQVRRHVIARVDVGEVVRRARLDLERVAEDLDVAVAHRAHVRRRMELDLVEQLRAVAADEVEELHGSLGREDVGPREAEHAREPGAVVDQVVEEHRPALGDSVVAEPLLLHLQARVVKAKCSV